MAAIIFFDGVCNLCTSAVQFTIRRDRRKFYKFASLQSPYAQELLGLAASNSQDLVSLVLWEDGRIYNQSTAALRIAKGLSGFWPLLYVLMIVPKFIRDQAYQLVARKRYQWFGRQESCWLPTPDLAGRFIV